MDSELWSWLQPKAWAYKSYCWSGGTETSRTLMWVTSNRASNAVYRPMRPTHSWCRYQSTRHTVNSHHSYFSVTSWLCVRSTAWRVMYVYLVGHSNYQIGPNRRYLLSKSRPFYKVQIEDRVRKITYGRIWFQLVLSVSIPLWEGDRWINKTIVNNFFKICG